MDEAESSTQSAWLPLPHVYGDYIFDSAIFRSAGGRIIYAVVPSTEGDGPLVFSLAPGYSTAMNITAPDCAELQRTLQATQASHAP